MNLNSKTRIIYNADNIDTLSALNNDCIDLIYLDPPFNKNKTFTTPLKSSSKGASFRDIFKEEDIKDEWVESINYENERLKNFLENLKSYTSEYNYCYIVYMSIRVLECHRVLKDTGTLFFHCDPLMSHYVKIMLDCVFGEKNFRNEIVWQRNDKREKGSQHKPKSFGKNSDIIFFYTKTDYFYFSPISKKSLDEDFVNEKFKCLDENNRRYYKGIPVFRSKSMGDRPNLCYQWKGFKNPYPSGWRLSKDKLEEEYKKGNIVITKNGKIERRKYLEDWEGNKLDNIWTDIPRVTNSRLYPTQKPLLLLERIIKAASPENGIVLDPFCGCATTCVAAEKLGRKWIGIDVSNKAYDLVKERIKKEVEMPLFNELEGYKDPSFSVDIPDKNFILNREKEKGNVYIISNNAFKGFYKVGIAKDVKARLKSYQTADPLRGYKIEFSIKTLDYRKIEKYIHEKFDNVGEWVKGDLDMIKKEIQIFQS